MIGKGDEVRAAVASLLNLEKETLPDFVIAARLDVADALRQVSDREHYDSGNRKYYPLPKKNTS